MALLFSAARNGSTRRPSGSRNAMRGVDGTNATRGVDATRARRGVDAARVRLGVDAADARLGADIGRAPGGMDTATDVLGAAPRTPLTLAYVTHSAVIVARAESDHRAILQFYGFPALSARPRLACS